jgi:formylglycine-generating enzyme required for sulfatase activity
MTRFPSDSNSADDSSENSEQYRSQGERDTRLDSGKRDPSSKSNSLEAFQEVLPPRYQLVREIGQGGMGQVILAIDRGATLKDHEYVAIKRMLGPTLSNSASVDRFLAEVKLARTLRHPNVVKMYHSDNTVLGPYIVMEYIDGEDLGKYIDRHGPLSEERALIWFGKLADALDEGHNKRLIHRDLKPKNILISSAGEPFLVDFGIAHRLSEMDRTGTGFGAGTIEYMSPEQLENRTPDVKQDVYSFGATIYHAVEGRPPFQADTVPRMILKVMSETAPSSLKVSSELAKRIASCLEKDPQKRPRSCKAILERLSQRETAASVPKPPPPPPSPSLPPVSPPDSQTREIVSSNARTQTIIASRAKAIWLAVLLLLVSGFLLGITMLVMKNPRARVALQPPFAETGDTEPGDNSGTRPSDSTGTTDLPKQGQSSAGKEPLPEADPPAPSQTPPASVESFSKTSLPEEFTNSIGMKFQLIKPGTFMMGSPASELGRDENETQHQVTLTQPYYLGVYEVTQEQYERIMGINPSEFKSSSHPVDSVSWEDAVAFISKLNDLERGQLPGRVYRLPTEAEWEYACRAGTTTAYSFGDSASDLESYAWYSKNLRSLTQTHPVGGRKPNPWGLYDMHGNVEEWCWDWFGDYPNRSLIDAMGPESGSNRVGRGGGWSNVAANCRSAHRSSYDPSYRNYYNGFRVALGSELTSKTSFSEKSLSMNEDGGGNKSSSSPSMNSPSPYVDPVRVPDEQFTNSIGMKFQLIKPGTFMMGSPASELVRDEDETQHQVTLTQPYYLGVYEVTQEQYERIMGINPSRFKSSSHPVDSVSWEDAVAFISKLNDLERGQLSGRLYRLPTEAEWEYACRAGTTTVYSFGASERELGNYAWYTENSKEGTHPVGEKLPNGWGLYDMHGNVSEWCADWYGEYPKTEVTDPPGPSKGSSRVRRGGCWIIVAANCRSAIRFWDAPDYRSLALGFRLALSPSGIPE